MGLTGRFAANWIKTTLTPDRWLQVANLSRRAHSIEVGINMRTKCGACHIMITGGVFKKFHFVFNDINTLHCY